MATTARRTPPLSVEDYLSLEEESPTKHEYVAGQLYALSGASRRHNTIAGNVAALLWNAARGGPCHVYGSDMRLRIGNDAVYYPDVQVVCEPDDAEERYTTAPCVVVEVLSPSTQSIDPREKLVAYRRIPSLQAYVIVYRDQMRVLRHWREDSVWYDALTGAGGRVRFPSPEVELTLAEIYEGLPALER